MKTNQYAAYVLLSIGLMVAYPLKGQETILSALDNTEVRVLMLPRHNAEPQLKTAQTNTIYVDSVK